MQVRKLYRDIKEKASLEDLEMIPRLKLKKEKLKERVLANPVNEVPEDLRHSNLVNLYEEINDTDNSRN